MKYLVGVVLILTSCTMSKELSTVKYSPKAHLKYSLDAPKGYELKILSVTVEKEHQYTYSDSSMIYLTNFDNTPNYENIKRMGDSIANFRFQNEEMTKEINQTLGREFVKILPDTFELSGIDNNSLYWKDIKAGRISIGYQKVPKEKKELFDKSLKTLRIK